MPAEICQKFLPSADPYKPSEEFLSRHSGFSLAKMALSPVIPSVSVVIVNHNAGSVLIDCLRSLAGQATEILLIDNGSDADGLNFVSENKIPPSVKIIRLPENVGFAAGCNIGTRACTQDVILFFNPDCIASPGLVQRLWGVLESDERGGMVGGLLLNPDGTEQGGGRRSIPTPWKSFVRAFGLWRILRSHDFHMESTAPPICPVEVDAISGACMMVRRVAFEEVGGFDEGFFLHCEDLDLCVEFKKHGWGVFFDPEAIVLHGKGVCSRARPVFVEWHKHWGMLRFYKKHFRSQYPAILQALVVAAVGMRFFLVVARLSLKPKTFLKTTPASENCCPQEDLLGNKPTVGVLGASSFVGMELLRLLDQKGISAFAYSRNPSLFSTPSIPFHGISVANVLARAPIHAWVSLCPIHALAGLLPLLELAGVRHLVAVSSTSKFTKIDSADASERRLAESLDTAEKHIRAWGEARGIRVFILRTTMIYDGIHDANVAAIAGFVRRFGWYPVLAPASGLRQPIHARDVAAACISALSLNLPSADYNISGGEILTYRRMVERVFESFGLRPRIPSLPSILLRCGVPFLRLLPRFRHLSFSMFQRMNNDLVFDHSEAARDLDFRPGSFNFDEISVAEHAAKE
jgi:GT2 family glycosyltransferase/nucleoside-diphosphate-sugar epimerase